MDAAAADRGNELMDVRLSGEQIALRESAARVVDQLGPRAVGQLDDAERAAKLDAAVESSGWRELRTPNDEREPWASAVEVAIVAEELGRGLADAAFLGPTLAVELRRLAGAEPSSAQETVALRVDLVTLADGGSDAIAIDTAGSITALALVGEQLCAEPLGTGRVAVDLTRPSVTIDSTATFAPIGATLTAEQLTTWTAFGLALTCADLVGTMRGAMTLATEYAKGREQYGTAIGSFQAVQHLLADAHTLMEGSRSVALHAAWAADALPPEDALAAAALAKAYCARAARTVCETAIQVHGGIGNTWECLAHVFLRRALLSTDVLGGVGPSLSTVLAHHGIGGGNGLR
jgi:alkylation response protein AidB-like acyl-CoA dehydrogenase